MKIIYLHQYFVFPDEPGGTRSYDLATKFYEYGYQVEIVTATSHKKFDNGRKWNTIEKHGLIVHYIYLPYNNRLSYLKRAIVFVKFLVYSAFKLFSLNGDIVLATSTPLTIGIPALLNKIIKKTPYIFEVRDVWPEAVIAIGAIRNVFLKRILYYLEKLIYRNAAAIVPLSTDMEASILNRYPRLSHKPIAVIENISEINRFQSNDNKVTLEDMVSFKPRFSVLYAGTFGKVNGIDYVIDLAFHTKKIDPTLIYLLIGDGIEKEAIQAQALEKGVLNQNVFILPSISKSDLPKWYKSVHMGSSFVIDIPQLWANSANKFFDTLAAGKPILINHEGWQAEKIRAADIGYVLPQQLTEEAISQFVKYTYNQRLLEKQSTNALEIAKTEYSLEIAANEYTSIIQHILAEK